MKTCLTLLTIVMLLPSYVLAAKASGTFIATQVCDLYQSKRNRTNPGNLKSAVDNHYTIREAILAGEHPEWLRVVTEAEVGDKLRWIEALCGTTENFSIVAGDSDGTSEDNSVACRTSNAYDSHVLAISFGSRRFAKCITKPNVSLWRAIATMHYTSPSTACGRTSKAAA